MAGQRGVYARVEVLLDYALSTVESNFAASASAAEQGLASLDQLEGRFAPHAELEGYAKALIEGDQSALTAGVFRGLESAPLSLPRIQLALDTWPTNLDTTAERSVRAWVESLSETLSITGVLGQSRDSNDD